MAVACAFAEGRAVTRAQHGLALVLDQHQLALQHMDELVFVRMRMPLARPVSRRQMHKGDAEISEPARLAEALADAFGAGLVEGRRIAGAFDSGYVGQGDLWHGRGSCRGRV